jgi:hypothetical protein
MASISHHASATDGGEHDAEAQQRQLAGTRDIGA